MTSTVLQRSLDLFDLQLYNLSEYDAGVENSFLDLEGFKTAVEHLKTARAESAAGNFEASWLQLVDVAEMVGKLNGVIEVSAQGTSKAQVKELLTINGRKGGITRGQKVEKKRDEAAKALIEAAPNGKWPSKAAFELKYHSIVKKVPGFSDTDYQRRKMLSRPDIKATLTSDSKRRRG